MSTLDQIDEKIARLEQDLRILRQARSIIAGIDLHHATTVSTPDLTIPTSTVGEIHKFLSEMPRAAHISEITSHLSLHRIDGRIVSRQAVSQILAVCANRGKYFLRVGHGVYGLIGKDYSQVQQESQP